MQTIIVELAQLWSNKKYATLICFFPKGLKKIGISAFVTGAEAFTQCIITGAFMNNMISTILWNLAKTLIRGQLVDFTEFY